MAIYQVVMDQLWQQQQVKNVLYYETTSTLDNAQLQEVADDIRLSWDALNTVQPQDDDWSYEGITARRVDLPDLPGIVVTPTLGNLIGTDASNNKVPAQIALLVSGSAQTTKPRRCRTYVAGLAIGALNSDGIWQAAARDNVVDFIENIDIVAVTGDTLSRVCARFTGTPPAVTLWNRVETYRGTRIPATQRRRRQGVGA